MRNLNDNSKIKHLKEMKEKFSDNLVLYEADLLIPDDFDEAMKSCSIVIHAASPYFLEEPKSILTELIQPALNGTLNVLASVNKTESVKKVILTSSVVSLYNNACDIEVGYTVQENDNNLNLDASHNSYAYSKSIAESLARSEQKKTNPLGIDYYSLFSNFWAIFISTNRFY